MEISEVTPVTDVKWPLWTWFAYPALAIAIGGGLGLLVGTIRQHNASAIQQTVEPVVAAPQPTTPSPEIEFQPEAVNAAGDALAPRVAPKSKTRPKPTKSTRCNVYDHMNGC